ncbi:MAG TPA: ABC transporter permease, partial [Gemmatimonadales bacterium]|nr:ABC transporter permease [Gemmatimonadales bacterium]
MTRFLAARLLLLVPTLLGVLALTFFLLYVAPGDPVQAMVGERADPETLARLRAELHLDDPLPVRFVRYVGGVLRGDLGTSYITRRPILGDLLQRFPATLRLAGAAMLFAAVTGIAIGIWGAWRPGGWADRIGALGAYLGVSFPVYWVGLILILCFAVYLRWLPPSGSGGLEYLILPAIALGMRSVAFLSRMTRAAMQEVLQSDYVRTARAKGLGEGRVVLSHAFRNALLPVVTVLGLDFGSYLTG